MHNSFITKYYINKQSINTLQGLHLSVYSNLHGESKFAAVFYK